MPDDNGEYSILIYFSSNNDIKEKELLLTNLSKDNANSLFNRIFELSVNENPPKEGEELVELKMRILNLSKYDTDDLVFWMGIEGIF